MDTPAAPAPSRILPASFAVAAVVSAVLGLLPILGLPCETCSGGALSSFLPWAGAAVYAALAVAAWRSPDRTWFAAVLGVLVFVHAELQTESLHLRRLCWACLAVAAAAFVAGGRVAWQRPSERVPLAAAIVLGAFASIFSPFERADDWLTRTLFPARILDTLPAFVNRDEALRCEHGSRVHLHVYEKDCKSCGSPTRKLLPRISAEFPAAQVCLHSHEVAAFPKGQRAPLFVVTTDRSEVFIIEGMPSFEDLRRVLHALAEGRAIPGPNLGTVPNP